jgi:putative spermidine/putrescine transport system substrate-binding protein
LLVKARRASSTTQTVAQNIRSVTLRIRLTVAVAVPAVASVALAACGAPASEERDAPPVNVRASSLKEGFATMDRLVEAARKEGTLTVIALPRDWVNYGEIINAFSHKYGLKVVELEPNAASQQEIDVAARDKGAATAPDVFDLTVDVAVANAAALAPYTVQPWQDIPDDLKDPQGAWSAAYGGHMSIGYDPRQVPAPTSFADLLKPGYGVAPPGNPLESATAFNAVMATSLRDGQARAERGVDFFAKLKRAGHLATDAATAPVVITWDHVNAQRAARSAGGSVSWRVVVPKDAVLAAHHVQAVNKNAPHPAAARLWQEFLFSDEGQNLFLKGFARPVRMEAMQMKGTIDKNAAAKLPPVTGTPVTLTIPEADTAKIYLQKHWPTTLG